MTSLPVSAVVTSISGAFPTVTADRTSLHPRAAASHEAAAGLIAAEGAAMATGLDTLDAAVSFARAVMGSRLVRLGPQFEATTGGYLANAAKVAKDGPDERGRVRTFSPPDEVMVPHNDGYGFGDYGPDYLFLWCEKPDADAGASWLLNGPGIMESLAEDPPNADLARFCWEVPIEHSEPNFIVHPPAPIARRIGPGRVQVRHNPYQVSAPGDPESTAHDLTVTRWHDAVYTARARAHRFHLGAGDLLCADNYRVLHGRDAYSDPTRKVVSIWGWSDQAVQVPDRPVSIVP
jgi:hypothetical protein